MVILLLIVSLWSNDKVAVPSVEAMFTTCPSFGALTISVIVGSISIIGRCFLLGFPSNDELMSNQLRFAVFPHSTSRDEVRSPTFGLASGEDALPGMSVSEFVRRSDRSAEMLLID